MAGRRFGIGSDCIGCVKIEQFYSCAQNAIGWRRFGHRSTSGQGSIARCLRVARKAPRSVENAERGRSASTSTNSVLGIKILGCATGASMKHER